MVDGGAVRTVLLAVLAVLTVGTSACTPFDDVMVAVFGRSMRDQPSFDPYENPRAAPEGSVPFSAGNYTGGPFAVNLGRADSTAQLAPDFTQADVTQQQPVVMELENPVEPTPESLERGEELYQRYCAVCHGDSGVGAEAYIADRHPVLAAYDLAGETVAEYPDGYIYGMIRTGRGLMPPYAHAVGHFDRWHIVNYVRQLQGQVPGQQDGAADD